MKEEFIYKYKIIEELQCEIDCLTQTCANGNEREKELKSSNEELLAEMSVLQTKNENHITEIASKNSALDRLQTVIDVFEKESQNSESDISNKLADSCEKLSKKEIEITQLKKELELLNTEQSHHNIEETNKLDRQLEEMSPTLTKAQQIKESYEEKIKTLENENKSLEELSSDIADFRHQLMVKDEETISLKEKLELKVAELSKKETENFDRTIYEKDEFYEKQQIEQIEMLRMQLKEKCELLEASVSDDTLKIKLEEKSEALEMKNQEIEDLRTIIRKSEVEKK